jgi:glycosyltransferase involved in cell wall biosynthesis
VRLIIHAPNVHCGGGSVLLSSLFEASNDLVKNSLLDARFLKRSIGDEPLYKVNPNIWSRIKAEWTLKKLNQDDILLCFGNLPPLFGTPANVFIFLQNRLLLEKFSIISSYPFRIRVRLIIEGLWLKLRLKKSDVLIVQTHSMNQLVSKKLKLNSVVMPFTDSLFINSEINEKVYDFIYIASGESHKNHFRLIEAWKLLRAEGLKPSLLLSISNYDHPKLTQWVCSEAKKYDLQIEIFEKLDRKQIVEVISKSKCHIYPSLLESYGLPLIESVALGIPIIASERDFVRDVCTPIETFDPESVLSIYRAIMRYLDISKPPTLPITAKEFLNWLQR